MEELNLRIFLLCTHSVVGALPLGILIVSDETTDTLVKGLKELKICIGDNAFYGRCEEGPSIIMTDNCSELRDALHQVWPNARLLLCIFHIMQQVWRWLHEKKNGIQNHDRPLLLKIIKSILYEKSEEKMHELIDNIEDNFLLQKYPKARRYFESVMDVKEAWALSYRTCLKTAQNNTNNYVESQFLVIKDEILNRVKEYNVVGLVEKLTIELDYHYKTKMLSLADGSFDGIYSRRFKGMNLVKDGENAKQLEKIASKIEVLENETFLVPSFTKIDTNYLVDMNLSICECPVGFNGAPCKHQYILWTSRLTGNCSNFLPVFSAPERQTYAKIAVGSAASIEFYEGLRDRIIPCKNENILSNESSSSRSPVNQLLEHTDFTVEEDINLQEENLHSKINEVDVAKQSLKDTFDFLSNQLSKDPSIPSGVIKFSKRLLQIPSSKLGTALHNFANVYTNSDPLKINSAKKTKRMKIKVQPEAVRRRKFKNGSRQKQSKGNIADVIPRRTMITGKRKHLFSQNVSLNQPMAKKSGRSMQSKTIQRNDRK